MLRMGAFLMLLAGLVAYGGFKLHVIYDAFAAKGGTSHVIMLNPNPIALADAYARAHAVVPVPPVPEPVKLSVKEERGLASALSSLAPAARPATPAPENNLNTKEQEELLNLLSQPSTAPAESAAPHPKENTALSN